MGLNLSESLIGEFDQCVGRDLLTYLSCPGGSRCFSYPQFLLNDNELINLANTAFPDDGCLPMTVQGTTLDEMKGKFGDLVIMRVNNEPHENDKYGYSEQSRYNSIYNPTYRGTPAVQFTALQRHKLSSMMLQVLEIQEGNIDFSKVNHATVHIYDDQSIPQTRSALIVQVECGKKKFYGPFEYELGGNGEVKLTGSSAYDFRIAGFNENSFDFSIDVMDSDGNIAAQFVDEEEFSKKLSSTEKSFDWIPDQFLIDIIGKAARASEDVGLTKKKAQALKRAISECQDFSEQITLTSERRDKMASLVNNYENWQSLSESAKREKIQNADVAQLAEFVLNDENFGEFFNKVVEHEGLRERVEQKRAKYRDEERSLEVRLEKAQAQVSEYENEVEKKKEELLAEVQEDAEEKRKESALIQEEIEHLSGEKHQLEDEIGMLKEDRILIQRQIRKAVEEMSDGLTVSEKILESEMLKQIVSAVNSNVGSEDEGDKKAGVQQLVTRDDESSLDDKQVIDLLRREIEGAGRDFEYNQIANMLICLMQGYITTFAGLPGTGKTSLASILSGVLGLQNQASPRFSEISVEKGWTSYKDFIGYYNPFTSSLERSAAFEAFELLDNESRACADSTKIPYFFLLDEANLSSMEHYWSPFLRACDSFRKGPFPIPLGDRHTFMVPEYVRFIATVNFDHTTEELSPRFLDRSWIITLDSDNDAFDDDDRVPYAEFSEIAPFSYGKLMSVFGPKTSSRMSNDSRSKLKEILDICDAYHFPISQRSQRMMKDYICTAEQVMDMHSAQSAYSPVDYAVAQKVLPRLSGTEDRVLEPLEKLKDVNALPEAKRRVERMLEIGSENGYYQYFG